jgi:cellulose synthase/poly-beta-1,6-N-acetylglucosamine synthase-like glycosyltransferase/peptidoglycan/xylan/chitin deacetylase (PgdA/CDA1 family)
MGLWVRARTDAEQKPARARRLVPPPRIAFAAIVLVVLANILLVEAYVNATFSPDGAEQPPREFDRVPVSVREGGPLLDPRGEQARSYHLPARTIALTFDDGPDPDWTPQIMRVLKRHDVPATFFVVGSRVARHPEITHRLAAEGHELGVHTFTHARMPDLPEWQRRVEYTQTELAIRHAANVVPTVLRLPYSANADSLDNRTWPLLREAGRLGYIHAFSNIDSNDWRRPGVDTIVRASIPHGDGGGVILLHDAGGDRSETVAALDRIIPDLKARGYQFTTVSEGYRRAVAATPDGVLAAPRTATTGEWWRGAAMVWAVKSADAVLAVLWVLMIAAGVLTLFRMVLLVVFAARHARRVRSPRWSWGPAVTEPVSVIVPAFNEREGIAGTVGSLARSDHPVEIVVVDDGSTDGTGGIVRALDLPNVRLVRVPGGGKANALNTGIALSRHDLIVTVDGDTVVEPDAIGTLVQPFARAEIGAVSGNVKVGNRRSLIARWQHIEYVIGFNLDRRFYETLNCIATVPGALGAYRRSAIGDAGGLSHDTLAEDTDLTIAIQRAGWRVVFAEGARAWTEAPATLSQLWRQRYRWSYGTMQAIWKHRRAVRDPGPSGRFGRIGLPILGFYTVVLPLLAPLIDILAVYGVVFLNREEVAVAWVSVLVIHLTTAVLAFRLDRERLRPLWALPLQQFLYRQLMYLVLMQSAITAITGGRLGWTKLQRTGRAADSAALTEAGPTPTP